MDTLPQESGVATADGLGFSGFDRTDPGDHDTTPARVLVPLRDTVQDIYARLSDQTSDDPGDELLHSCRTYRAIFLSDIHLGAPGCRAGDVVQFLNHAEAEYIYWNGDIFDLWHLRIFDPTTLGKLLKGGSLSRAQLTLVQKILREDRKGARQIYIPGNHDEAFRTLIGDGFLFGNKILTLFDAIHETRDGRRFLVMHGDSFDVVVHNHRWLGILGTRAFGWLANLSLQIDKMRANDTRRLSILFNRLLEIMGFDRHWSLAQQIRAKTDGAAYDASYQQAMLSALFQENATLIKQGHPPLSGIICGHTHVACAQSFLSPLDKDTGLPVGPAEVTYYNTGHWTGRPVADGVDIGEAWRDKLRHPTCTALVEHRDGRMELVRWAPGKGIVPLIQQ